MSNGLDKYLQTVEAELHGLREEKRELELHEMRQHLEATVARLCESGLSREEAIEAAIVQFGTARTVGRELQQAGMGYEPRWRTLVAPVCAFVWGRALNSLLHPALIHYFFNPSNPSLWWVLVPMVGWLLALSSGVIAGYLSPRWGGRLLLCLKTLQVAALILFSSAPTEIRWQQLLLMLVSNPTSILLGASLGSRLARKHQGTQKARPSDPTEVA